MNPFVLQHPARIETLFVIPDGFLFILKAGHDVNFSFTSLFFFFFFFLEIAFRLYFVLNQIPNLVGIFISKYQLD